MRKFMLLAAVVLVTLAALSGCKSDDTGSREFIPGKGWKPVD